MRIEIEKKAKTLRVFDDEGNLLNTFAAAFGFAPSGSKEVEGDGKTPEGEYVICVKNPKSKFHLSLGLNYPNDADAERGLTAGLITQQERDSILEANLNGNLPPQNTTLGGEIYIHGGGTDNDWTRGCVGLNNDDMTDLFDTVETGTQVSIRE